MDFSQVTPDQLESLTAKMSGAVPGPSMNRFKSSNTNVAPLEFASGKAPDMVNIPLSKEEPLDVYNIPKSSSIEVMKEFSNPEVSNVDEIQALKNKIAQLESEQRSSKLTDPVSIPVAPVAPISNENLSLRAKIDKLEFETGKVNYRIPETSADSYKSETGENTYYVRNISNGHVVLTDPDLTIRQGDVIDLLVAINYDEIKNWQSFRTALRPPTPMLKRITEVEYFQIMQERAEMQRKVKAAEQQDLIRKQQMQQNNPMGQNTNNPMANPAPMINTGEPRIKTAILVQLNNLELSQSPNPDNNKFGITSMAFIEWLMRETLTQDELDYLLTYPLLSNKHDIKAAILQKKNMI